MTVEVKRNVAAEMRDGTVLRADVYRPAGKGTYPVLLQRTPYDKSTAEENARLLAESGYVVVAQDKRGRYESNGEYVWMYEQDGQTEDGEDGYDTVEWAARLPGSDGRVGTWGFSYPSWCIWRMAGTAPPSLAAIYSGGMAMSPTDMNFGVFETARRLQWTYGMAVDARRRIGDQSQPNARAEADTMWHEFERGKWIWYLPLGEIPDEVFSTLAGPLKKYMTEQNIDFWRFDKVHPKVKVATCNLTGWFDRLVGAIDHYAGMAENGPENLREQHRLVVGPWGHATMGRRLQGPLDFGPDADGTYVGEMTRWYDHVLKGVENGLGDEPPVKLFIMGENRWRFEDEWPLARTEYTDFYLDSGGSANTPRGDGMLSAESVGNGQPDEYDYDPRDPVMSLMDANGQAVARDQAPLANRRDILVYQTAPLEKEIEVTGPVTLKLWAASTAPDTDFTAKLIDVHPDGLAVNLTYGILRASYRNGMDKPSLIEPGRPYEYMVKLNPTGMLFQRGHRIRLDVSSSDFPNFDRNHNTGADFWSDAELRVARQTVFHDTERPSRLVLPVIPRV